MSESRWRSLLENAPEVVMSIVRDGTIIYSNQVDGNGQDLFAGRTIFDFLPPGEDQLALEQIKQVYQTGERRILEWKVITPERETRWFSVHIGPMFESDGNIGSLIVLANDIHDRKIAEENLIFSKKALSERAEQLATLNRIGRSLSTLRDFKSALRATLEEIKSIFPLDVFFVALKDSETTRITFPILYDDGNFYENESGDLTENTLTSRVILSGEPLLKNYTYEEIQEMRENDILFGEVNKAPASVVMVPLQSGEKIIGVIALQSYEKNTYNDVHLSLMVGASYQIAIAIENSRLYDALLASQEASRRQADQLATLNKIGRVLSNLKNLHGALQVTLEQIKAILPLDTFFIALSDMETNRAFFPLLYDSGKFFEKQEAELTEDTLTSLVIRSGQPLLINRTYDEIEHLENARVGDTRNPAGSILMAPLQVGEKTIGVVSLQSYTPNTYNEDTLSLLVGASHQIAIAIENARLYEELLASQEVTRQRAEQLATLNQIGQVLSTLKDFQGALELTLDQIQLVVPFDVFQVSLYDTETNQVSFPLVYDSGTIWRQDAIQLDETTFVARVINSGEPFLLNRTVQEIETARQKDDSHRVGVKDKISASIIAVPLRVGASCIGVISAHSYKMDAYDEDDLYLLMGASHPVAIAIENARLYEALQKELGERKKAEDEVRKLNTGLEARVLARTAELEAANRDLESFTYTVSHDLRAPLRAIHGFSRILMQEHTDELSTEAKEYLWRVAQNSLQMGSLIDDLLAFSRLGRKPVNKQVVDVEKLCWQAFRTLTENIPPEKIQFSIGTIPAVQADPALLNQVLINLLSNAIKFSQYRDVIKIEIGGNIQNGETIFYVKDNGAGFDMKHASKLFGVFQRLHSSEEFDGTGVGLAIVQRIIEKHGGRVWAESEVDKGSTFYFTLGK
jgi:PAS domain S-box-containing protein